MTPKEVRYNNTDTTAKVVSPIYPSGSGVFALQNVPSILGTPIATINSSTGVITITSNLSAYVGIYDIQVSYRILGTDYYRMFRIIIDGVGQLNKTIYVVPREKTTPTYFQLTNEIENCTDFTIFSGDTNFTDLTTSGVLEFTHEGSGTKVCVVQYKSEGTTLTGIIGVEMIDVAAIGGITYEECPKDSMLLVWLNEKGGWDTYNFVQAKTYEVSQSDAARFINSNMELRYSSRGKVYQGVDVSNQLIPKEHIEKISSLRDAIQVYMANFTDDEWTFTPVIIDQGNYTLYTTEQENRSLSFKFLYALNKVIQNQ